MKKTILFTCLIALLAACSRKSAVTAPEETTVQPVNLILDTDLGPDYDDVGAMALMHALADSGQVNILAIRRMTRRLTGKKLRKLFLSEI